MSGHSLAERTLLQGVEAPLSRGAICKKLSESRPMGSRPGNVTVLLCDSQKLCSLFDIRSHPSHLGFQFQALLSDIQPLVRLGLAAIDASDYRSRDNQSYPKKDDYRTRDNPASQGQPKTGRESDQPNPHAYEPDTPTDPIASTHKGTLLRRRR